MTRAYTIAPLIDTDPDCIEVCNDLIEDDAARADCYDTCDYEERDPDGDNGWTDADYDADTLASAGWGTDEDYGYYGEEW